MVTDDERTGTESVDTEIQQLTDFITEAILEDSVLQSRLLNVDQCFWELQQTTCQERREFFFKAMNTYSQMYYPKCPKYFKNITTATILILKKYLMNTTPP